MADLQAPLDGALVGYRVWLSGRWPEPPRLVAMAWPVAWDPIGVNEARCLTEVPAPRPHARLAAWWTGSLLAHGGRQRERHEAPASHCGCGLYAYGSLSTALAYVRSQACPEPWRPGPYNLLVLGAVLLWGRGERRVRIDAVIGAGARAGLRYRAPYARVLALLGTDHPDDTAHEVGAALGLPVLPERGLEPYARKHGVQLRLPEEVGS